MLKGKTKSNFAFEIDENIGDDWEILEMLNDITTGDLRALIQFGNAVLGKEQLTVLKEHIRKECGRVSTQRMSEELMDIFSSLKDAKN